ncbi:hypothetical protein GYMLUDRAFT_41681 [Collybiopsis luxurians FD-317 M1]|uniref:Cytochrome P450 n=1 Tax=Collybiopsis luxurians FD-317 M1 TaxID=944289 RepID=A0A0D0CTL0_9AGAR|nr:hypothetical protein GYMLUDRAFT_41681 [Collybiopsis luxurians FD-317 M1]
MLVLLVSFASIYCAGLALYRLLFHPLREYPGPALAALTEGYEAYYNIIKGGNLVAQYEKLHKQYGPVVRVGPNTLHFNYAQAYHDIYTHGSTLVKEPAFYKNINPHSDLSSFALRDPQEAKIRRGLVGPAFSRRAVTSHEDMIQQKVHKFIQMLEEHHNSSESSVDTSDAYFSLTTDIITSYCFDNCFDTLDTPGFSHYMPKGFQEAVALFWVMRHLPFLGVLLLIYTPPNLLMRYFTPLRGFVELKSSLESQIDRWIRDPQSLSETTTNETIYHYLFKTKDQKHPSRMSLIHEAFILFSAGSDTTSNALNIGTIHASKDTSISRRLFEELCEAFPDEDRPMSHAVLENLPFLTAFIRETLRFAIGAVHPLPRVVGPTTPAIGGLKIPAGTIVEMSTAFMHMNPEVFPDPNTFNPDRWLVEDTTEMMQYFCPFSKGPRICLGLNLAWCELYLTFGNLFRKVDLKLVSEEGHFDQAPIQQIDYFVLHWRERCKVYVEKSKK